MWIIQDMVELFNTENPLEKVSYYVVRQIIKNEKHLFKIGKVRMMTVDVRSVRMWSCCFQE